jgi:citrate lyase alpha subunit
VTGHPNHIAAEMDELFNPSCPACGDNDDYMPPTRCGVCGYEKTDAQHAVIVRLLDGWVAEDWWTNIPAWVRPDDDQQDPEEMSPAEAAIIRQHQERGQ